MSQQPRQATIFNEVLPAEVTKWGRVGELVYELLIAWPGSYKDKWYIAEVFRGLGAESIEDLFSGKYPSVAYVDRVGRELVRRGIIQLPGEVETWRRDQERKTRGRYRRR